MSEKALKNSNRFGCQRQDGQIGGGFDRASREAPDLRAKFMRKSTKLHIHDENNECGGWRYRTDFRMPSYFQDQVMEAVKVVEKAN